MHAVVCLNEKNFIPDKFETYTGEERIWYLDNGPINPMTRRRRYFSKLDNTVTGKVRFGDDSHIDNKGKCTISFTDMHGESRKMTNVYFIPDLRRNIISLGPDTESGCDIRLRKEYLTMHDHNGKLLVKTNTSKNRLYKVCMGVRNTELLHLATISEITRWHVRLGHINLEVLKSMI